MRDEHKTTYEIFVNMKSFSTIPFNPLRFEMVIFRDPYRVFSLVDSDEKDELGKEQGGHQVFVDAEQIGS